MKAPQVVARLAEAITLTQPNSPEAGYWRIVSVHAQKKDRVVALTTNVETDVPVPQIDRIQLPERIVTRQTKEAILTDVELVFVLEMIPARLRDISESSLAPDDRVRRIAQCEGVDAYDDLSVTDAEVRAMAAELLERRGAFQ